MSIFKNDVEDFVLEFNTSDAVKEKIHKATESVATLSNLVEDGKGPDTEEYKKQYDIVKQDVKELTEQRISDAIELTLFGADGKRNPVDAMTAWLEFRFIRTYSVKAGKKANEPKRYLSFGKLEEITLEQLCKASVGHFVYDEKTGKTLLDANGNPVRYQLTTDKKWRERLDVLHENLCKFYAKSMEDNGKDVLPMRATSPEIDVNANRFGFPYVDTEERKVLTKSVIYEEIKDVFKAILSDEVRGRACPAKSDVMTLCGFAVKEDNGNPAYLRVLPKDKNEYSTFFIKYVVGRYHGKALALMDNKNEEPSLEIVYDEIGETESAVRVVSESKPEKSKKKNK